MIKDPARPQRLVTWADLHADARALARGLLARQPGTAWKGIVAITRGGLVPAAVLARELGLRIVDTLCIASYDGDRQGTLRTMKLPRDAAADHGAGWILVDDIIDSGATARAARNLLTEAVFCTLFQKPQGRGVADLFVHEIAQDIWVHFPWDTAVADGGVPVYTPPLTAEAGQ